jgi:ferredoxin
MDSNSRIFWFSGTGNSLYAAKQLSAALGDITLEQITDAAPKGILGGKNAKIGFVFPSYYCNLPRAVKAFVEKLEIRPDTYIFAIVTMGGPGQGSVAAMKKALNAKGLRLNYGRGLKMPSNYILLYNPADSSKSDKALQKTDERLRAFAVDISAEKQMIKSLPFIMNGLYKNIGKLDADFSANEKCASCSLCEKICPVKNIRLESGKPKWLHRCEHCVACISWCPARAIEYGEKTKSRRRYCNPRIDVKELLRQEITKNQMKG